MYTDAWTQSAKVGIIPIFKYMYMYIYIHTYTYIHIYLCMYICIYTQYIFCIHTWALGQKFKG